jgi:hypothetical protein
MIPDAVRGAMIGGLIGFSAAIAVALLDIRQADWHRFADSKVRDPSSATTRQASRSLAEGSGLPIRRSDAECCTASVVALRRA